MKKIYTIIAAALITLTANAQSILPTGKVFRIGEQIKTMDELATATADQNALFLIQNYGDNRDGKDAFYQQNTTDGKISTFVKTPNKYCLVKIAPSGDGYTIQAYNANYYQTNTGNQTEITTNTEPYVFTFTQAVASELNFRIESISTPTNQNYHCYLNTTTNGNTKRPIWNTTGGTGNYSRVNIFKANIIDRYTVTWSIKYNGKTTTKTTIVAQGEDAVVPEIPFTTITPVDAEAVKNITEDKTIEATATFNTPFTSSTDYSSATWYYLKAGRGTHYAYYNSNSSVSTSGNKTNTKNYKWAFIGNPIDGYKVINKESGDSKFVYAANGNNSTMLSMSDAETIWQIVDGSAQAANTFTFYLNGTSGGYWNSYDNNNAIGMWQQSVTDSGSRWLVEEAEADEDVQYTVTWNIKENGSDNIITILTTKVAEGETATLSASYPFTTLSPTEKTNVTKDVTVDVTATFSTPFTASTDYATATWYYIGSANKEHSSVNQPAYIYYNSESSNTIPFGSKTNSAAYKWAFIGNPINGYQIINKAAGEKNYVYDTSNSAPHIANTEQNDGWKVAEAHFGKETSRTAFGININGGNTYWNAGAQNITYYGFDDGSHWFVEEALQDESITLHESDGKMYATTCQPIAFSLSEGVTAYKVTEAINSDSETGTATLTAIDGDIPAGEPVVLIADNTNTTSVELTPSSDNTLEKSTDNKLQGVLSATAPTTTNYYFGQFGGKPGFYHTNINSVSSIKNKAYLPSDFAGANAASKGYAFSFGDDDVTGINSATETATTADENATRYNLQGQRVGKDAKGIIIIGGKKYIIK